MSCAPCHRLLQNLFVLGDELIIDQNRRQSASITYRQARSLIAWLDHAVKGLEKRPTAIGILSNHRAEAYLSVLYAFVSGIKFVPLNPGLPTKRLQRIVELANVDLIIFDETHTELASELECPALDFTAIMVNHLHETTPLELSDCNGQPAAADDAYHMFTSGSTGEPKGVPITRANLAAYVVCITDFIPFPDKARFSQFFDLSFDLSMHDIFVAVHAGGTIVPPSALDLLLPANYVEHNKIDVWFSVPVLAQVACQGYSAEKNRHKLSLALFCGEALPTQYINKFRVFIQPDAAIYNLYGPTEATIACTGLELGDEDCDYPIAPIGTPFGWNIACLYADGDIIDANADGQEGELLLAGPQVFGGYRPAQDAETFVEKSGIAWYRSGDLVRFQNGKFHHLGRLDNQIKIRGHRIEYGEIEVAFRKAFDLDFVAAFAKGDYEEKKICLAYVADKPIEEAEGDLATLPDYMRPQDLYRVEHIPTNINGKVDRDKLSAIVANSR